MSGPAERASALPLEAERVPAFERVDLVHVSLPFVKPFSISTATWTGKETFLVRVEGGGKIGWGECVADPDPFYAPETTTSARHVVAEFLLPLVEPGLTFLELDARFGHVRGKPRAGPPGHEHRDPQPARQHAKSFHVITVLVRDENRVEFVQALSQLGGPQLELFHTETAIDKHPGARRHDQNGVAAAAASQ